MSEREIRSQDPQLHLMLCLSVPPWRHVKYVSRLLLTKHTWTSKVNFLSRCQSKNKWSEREAVSAHMHKCPVDAPLSIMRADTSIMVGMQGVGAINPVKLFRETGRRSFGKTLFLDATPLITNVAGNFVGMTHLSTLGKGLDSRIWVGHRLAPMVSWEGETTAD